MTLEQGAILHGRYRIVEILGQGGMGSVYRAIDENLGVEVAVKENLFTTDEYARQFRLEAVILASLHQPNLPRVTDHFMVGEQGQYLVMDYIEGEDLRQRMERLGTIPEEEAILIGAAICDALAYLHTRKPPVLHRDIKPGNVKITPEGHVYLVDFGLAKVVRGSQATTTGARAMTPGYSPPEQYGTARTDAHSDIYSLGATLYAALTGVIPEDGLARVMDNVQLTPLRKRNPKISRKLAAAIEKAMEPYPDERFKSDEEFKLALLAASAKTQKPTGDLIIPPPPVSPDQPPSTPLGALVPPAEKPIVHENTPARLKRRRKRSLGWLAFSLLLLLVIIITFGVVIKNPSLIPASASGLLPPGWLPSATPTMTQTIPATPTSETAVPVVIIKETPSQGPTKRPTSTLTITSSPTFTLTPSITPTLIGGGLGTIAFASNRSGIPQIYLMNADGTDQRAITTETDGACQPDWSPDGTQIVYISPCMLKGADYPGANLFIMNADGSNKQPLGGSIEGDFDPVWSPDGKSIAFTSLRDGKDHPQIYKMNLETKEVTRLTYSDKNIQTRQPAWSPDGTQILYTLRRVGVFQIWVMTSAGKAQQQLVRSGAQYSDFFPAWSQDGGFISFSETESFVTSPSPAWLMTMRYEDRKSQASVRVNVETPIVDVNYSPDGYWLVFESVSADPGGSNQDIYIMTISGGDRTRLTRDPDIDFDPAWKPLPKIEATVTSTP